MMLHTLLSEADDDVTPYNIVQDLRSQDLATQIKAFRSARSTLYGKKLPTASMVEAGITSLVDALDRDGCLDLQHEALNILTIVAFGTYENAIAVVNSGAIPKLISFLAHDNDLAQRAILSLGNFSLLSPAARHAVLARGAVRAMLPHMRTDTPVRRLRTFVRAYSNLCSPNKDDDDKTNLELVSLALPYIRDILDIEHEESLDPDDKEIPFIARDIIVDACTALSNIMLGPDECIEAVQLVPGLTARLVGLLGHEGAAVREAALSAVGNMLAGTDVQIDRCLDANCLDHIVSLLQTSHFSLVKEAARATGNILAGTQTQIQQALENDILISLRNILANGEPECQKQALHAVTNLCCNGSATQRAQLVLSGALQPYCAMLAAEERAVAGEVLDGLHALMQDRSDSVKPLCYMLDECDVLDQMLHLQEQITDEVQHSNISVMSAILHKHARDERYVVYDEMVYTTHKIVQDLESPHLEIQTRASRAASCTLTELNPPVTALLEAGIMTALVKQLDMDACYDLQYAAALAFSNITAGTRKHKTAVIESGAIPKLIALLVRGSEIAELASCSLGNVALHGPETRNAVLAYIQHSDSALMEMRTFVGSYKNLCSQVRHESKMKLGSVLRALPFMSVLLDIGDKQIMREACQAFANLMLGPDSHNIEAVQAVPRLTTRLVALLRHEATDVREPALMAVGLMLAGTDAQADHCIDAGCLDHIVNLLQCCELSLVEEAVRATISVFGHTHTQIQRALNKGILNAILSILDNGTAECQKQAAYAITNLCRHGPAAVRARLASRRVLQPCCALLATQNRVLAGRILDLMDLLIKDAKKNKDLKALCFKLDKIGFIDQLQQLQDLEIEEDLRHKAVVVSAILRRQAREEYLVVESGKGFSIEDIVRELQSQVPATKMRAARAAYRALCEQDAPVTAMVQAGLVAPLLAALDRDGCPDLQLIVVVAVANFTAGTHKNRLALINGGVIPKLIALLSHEDLVRVGLAAVSLGNMTCGAAVTRDLVLAHDAVRAILPHLRRDQPLKLLRSCVTAYRMWCTDIVSESVLELLSPALPYISELLDIEDQEILDSACSAFTNLMCHPDGGIILVQAVPGLTARLVGLLGHEAHAKKKAALGTISNMLRGTESQANHCLDAGCLDYLVPLLRRREPELLELAVGLTTNVLSHTDSQIQRALDKGLLTPLLKVLADAEDNSYIQYNAIYGLVNIAEFGTLQHMKAIVDAGAIPMLVTFVAHGAVAAEPAAGVLAIIAHVIPETRDEMLSHGLVQAMLPHLHSDTSVKLLTMCVWAYSNFCRGDDENLELVSPALPYIAVLLRECIEDEQILEHICWAIVRLTKTYEGVEAVQATPGLTTRLVGLLEHDGFRVKAVAIMAVVQMLSGIDTQLDRCLDAGCIEQLASLVQSSEADLYELAGQATCLILSGNHSQIQRALDRGILTPLLSILADAESSSELRKKIVAVGALFFVTLRGTREQKMTVVDSGAIPILVALLSHEATVADRATETLANISGLGPETRDLVLAHGAVRAMMPHMSQDTPPERLRRYVETFGILCRHEDDEPPVKLELVSPALPHLAELLAVGDEQVLEQACRALAGITRTYEGIEAVQATPGLTTRLMGLLRHEGARVKSAAIVAVILMLSGNDAQFAASDDDNMKQFSLKLVEMGVLDQLKILREHEDDEIKETACRLLSTYFPRESRRRPTMEFAYFLKLCFHLSYEIWNQM